MLNLLNILCMVSLPFVFRGSKMRENILVFFLKGVISMLLDSYVVGTKKIAYPVRPFSKIFSTNIIYDLLFFPILSVIWVRISYHDNLKTLLLKSMIFSVPMSLCQWWLEKNSRLFEWKKWSVFHTFGSINFTLFLVRGIIGFLKRVEVMNQESVTNSINHCSTQGN
ncbi:MAG: CBO0543 family protein [Bacillota bacterium]|nr:CBO0543 family protein [Bacillota bacterium]